ncbi:RagB/SusD domain-containing protein [Flavobacterium sp. 1]|uniref:RagB/SusD family nutrient uptake outer membrane protein n=1 Tax=Flavobacterium sp. 1 TaxID=2035200 RepID=UPI000C23C41F|nr:RagB/SusD family nutrient uptake outer membrane protein [Flavobacterium sp. 1]PJJ07611.1 RagB/SusD domain-containing protein [Flavobacterium sp. 1]
MKKHQNIIKKQAISFGLKIMLLVSSVIFADCESFVEVEVPNTQLTGVAVFNDSKTAEAALIDIYSKLRNSVLVTGDSNGISILLGNYADEITYYSNGALPEEPFYRNNLLPSSAAVTSIWNDSYNLIYAANAVIEGVEKSEGILEADKKKLIAEAVFIRSYIHFYLLNLYGEIPYITTTDYQINASVTKMTSNFLYPILISNVETAVKELPAGYSNKERIRPNSDVAKALLAKLNLYANNWSAAQTAATEIINNTAAYRLASNLDEAFLKTSLSTLWQLIPQTKGMNTLEAKSFIFTSGPPPNRALTNDLVNAFEIGDQRKTHWLGSITKGSETWYYPFKYKLNNNTASSMEYSILFRLEEIYLIKAEAYARLNQLTASKEDLNKIRNRSGLINTTAITQSEILNAILHERQVELFTEQGQRWFDLKRFGKLDIVLKPIKPGWNTADQLWPLPENELLLNKNLLPQNPGY